MDSSQTEPANRCGWATWSVRVKLAGTQGFVPARDERSESRPAWRRADQPRPSECEGLAGYQGRFPQLARYGSGVTTSVADGRSPLLATLFRAVLPRFTSTQAQLLQHAFTSSQVLLAEPGRRGFQYFGVLCFIDDFMASAGHSEVTLRPTECVIESAG
jgi:hypothetical protein